MSILRKLQANEERTVINQRLGVPVNTAKGLMSAATASPVSYINGTEPPFLIIHGDQDDVVSINQSYMLRDELLAHGCSIAMHTVFGRGHGFNNPAVEAVINDFLDYHLK